MKETEIEKEIPLIEGRWQKKMIKELEEHIIKGSNGRTWDHEVG